MSAKNSNELQYRVRRRLFTEDVAQKHNINKDVAGDEKSKETPTNFDDDEKDQVVAEFLELCDVDVGADATPQAVTSNDIVSKIGNENSKLCINRALVISMSPEISPVSDYIDQSCQRDSVKVKVSNVKPDEALELANRNLYDVIFTDVDLATDNEILRIIIAVRKFSCINHGTPIFAVDQNRSHYRVHDFTYKYGVNGVYFAPLKVDHIKEAIEAVTKKGGGGTVETENRPKEHDYGLPSCTTLQTLEIPTYEEVQSFTIPSTSKQIYATPLSCNILQYSKTVSVIESFDINKTTSSVIKPTVQYLTSEKVVTPTSATTTHAEKQQNIVRPIMQKPNLNVLPKTTSHPANYQPSNDKLQSNAWDANYYYKLLSKFPKEYSYMVSGQNHGTNQITILPEDTTKHSTKERMRRIRRCSDEFRALLPSFIHSKHAKRMDMATLMERTVFYLKLLKENAQPKYLKECEEIFEFFFYHTAPASKCNKRRSSEIRIDEQIALPAKRTKSSSGKQVEKKSTAAVVTQFPSHESIASTSKPISEALLQPHQTFSSVSTTSVSAQLPSASHQHQFPQMRYMDPSLKSNYLFRPQYPLNFHNQPVHLPPIPLPQVHTVYGGYHMNNGSGLLQARQQQNMYPINALIMNGYQTDPVSYLYSPSRQTYKM